VATVNSSGPTGGTVKPCRRAKRCAAPRGVAPGRAQHSAALVCRAAPQIECHRFIESHEADRRVGRAEPNFILAFGSCPDVLAILRRPSKQARSVICAEAIEASTIFARSASRRSSGNKEAFLNMNALVHASGNRRATRNDIRGIEVRRAIQKIMNLGRHTMPSKTLLNRHETPVPRTIFPGGLSGDLYAQHRGLAASASGWRTKVPAKK